jgi:DNA-binding NarL/FixJ family response regulator
VRAVLDVAEGDAPVSPQVARHLLSRFAEDLAPSGKQPETPSKRLTAREAEILTLVSQGHSGPEVASRLGLSLHTVNTHLRRCHQKLDARNRLQAVNLARDSGLID